MYIFRAINIYLEKKCRTVYDSEKNLTIEKTAELTDADVLKYLMFIYYEKNIQFILKGYVLSLSCFSLRGTLALY